MTSDCSTWTPWAPPYEVRLKAPSPEAVSWDKTLRTEAQAAEHLGVPGPCQGTPMRSHTSKGLTLAYFRAFVNMSDSLPSLFPFKFEMLLGRSLQRRLVTQF